ncbi:PKD repeat protein [Methanolinea mesophila]|uniref:PKD domain-containing protein n=1 Tax=Methanolinea mesophila TaxID=547055 RepID=UPI001AE40670|nr:PKD repeat protein [Methanolinea mesophila]
MAYDARPWIIGGYSRTENSRGSTIMQWLNDVWSTTDGRSWRLENSSPAFGDREFVPLAVFNDSRWIAGGGGPPPFCDVKYPPRYAFDSVWHSGDGITWTMDTEHAGFSPRYGQGVAAFKGGLWVIGGSADIPLNDVWYYGPLQVPPEVSFRSNVSGGTVPLAVEYTGAWTGDITAWSWDFGDGSRAATPNTTHIFRNPGMYTVVLEVAGPDGSDRATEIIRVEPGNKRGNTSFRRRR